MTAAVAPPGSMADGFFRYDQLRRSWYVFFFQTPLADYAVGLDDYAFIDRLWADWSPGFDGSWDVARVKESIGTPERAGRSHRVLPVDVLRTSELARGGRGPGGCGHHSPTTDAVSSRRRRRVHGGGHHRAGDRVPGPGSKMVVVEGTGHFLQVEKPDEVNDHIIAFLAD